MIIDIEKEEEDDDVYSDNLNKPKASIVSEGAFDISEFYNLSVNPQVKDLLGFMAR